MLEGYQAAVDDQIRPLPQNPEFHDLVRYGTLAANGHNTQPWQFRLVDREIRILPDFSRRTPVVDPDDHHLFASLGCASENLSISARANGFSGETRFEPGPPGSGRVELANASPRETDLLAAIRLRQCSRVVYDGQDLSGDTIGRLTDAANSYGVDAMFISDKRTTEDILALVLDGNARQIDDPAFVAELKAWIRFNTRQALATRDGLYSGASGNPVLPTWLSSIAFGLFFKAKTENDKYAKQVRSSAGIVVFVADSDDPNGWFNAGRAYQRFALQATIDGVKNAFINQAVEVPEVRRQLQAVLGLGDRRPNLVVRYGYGPTMPRSLRRPVDTVIV